MNNLLIISVLITSLISCSARKKVITSEPLPQIKVEEILGTKFDCVKNASGLYKLCSANVTVDNVKYVSFAVFEITTNVLVYKSSQVRKVRWQSENEIRVDNFTRMPTGEGTDDYYLYNIISKEKSTINQ